MHVTVLDRVGKNDTEQQTRSSDMAGLVRNATDSVGRSGMDSSSWLSRPWTASSFTQQTIDKGKVRCTQVVSCSQETTDNKLPMYSFFATAWIVMSDEIMLRQAGECKLICCYALQLLCLRSKGEIKQTTFFFFFKGKSREMAACHSKSRFIQGNFQTFTDFRHESEEMNLWSVQR